MFSNWLSVIKRYECASILSLAPYDRHYRIAQFLTEKADIFNRKKIRVTSLTFRSMAIEEPNDFFNHLNQLIDRTALQNIIIIIDAEWLIASAPQLLTTIPQVVLNQYRKISFLMFFEKNILASEYQSFTQNCLPIVQNVEYLTLYKRSEMEHYIRHLENLYHWQMRIKERETILDSCGGHIWLVTEAVRHLHQTGKVSFDHEAMRFRLQTIWQGFSTKEQEIIRKVIYQQEVVVNEDPEILFLLRTNLLFKVGHKLIITVPILKDYVKSIINSVSLQLNSNQQIVINGISADTLLTLRENQLLAYFLQHKGEVITKDQIGELLWQDKWSENGSDWAIDQVMRRLRKKLFQLSIDKNTIRTIKGKGYIFQNK
ncbi:helix-turn-helix domain-containing protein [Patescibacteria group bacterium]|nr:helix-turn-helix domain-containing protein [Patescibacteria group bacterium]MBU1472455.1 helix-turn-helix domain-containing protein [Patescibacteria group bacterium]MBU2460269.1 helix-turn-helix domain-containing protein [Patescibacteria group bacterium]MBU2543947.1 helix-turn-helix domain-containing protein [Patescibacteria group bacterium]